jgi:LacI family transcriptional regulator
VLNQTRPVSDARERVLAAVKELDYVPSALARSLRSKVTGSIGLIIPNNTNPYFSELARASRTTATRRLQRDPVQFDDDPDKQRDYLVLQTKRCDGLIIATLNQSRSQPGGQARYSDRAAGPRAQGTGHRPGQHRQRLGGSLARATCWSCSAAMWPASPDRMDWNCRTSACRDSARHCRRAGAGRGDLLHADFSGIGGYQAAMQCREDEGQRPDAIFCCNDMMAIGVLRAAGELQIEVPGELSVVGFDDIELAQFVHPPLTTVAQNTRSWAT